MGAPLDKRTQLGTRDIADEEVRAVALGAVDTFLKAFAAP
ncbi:hypothetical protein [Actinomadura madurae]|nr:hypothetical protein [Actinomadura madurae]